jgi:hypothetical protein
MLLYRWWGWALLAILLVGWGKLDPLLMASIIAVAATYFMFRAPVWCGAVTRDDTLCRNNASGLLMGCHLREHRWQKLRMAFVPRAWQALGRRVWRQNRLQVVGLLLTSAAAFAGAVQAAAAVIWHP